MIYLVFSWYVAILWNNLRPWYQLIQGYAYTYQYDTVGNRTAAHVNGEDFTFSYNKANQIVQKNDTAYQYDADGNLLQDEHYQYTYNEAQHLIGVQTLKGDGIASYTYDENGLRLTKTVGDTTHEYLYNDEVLDMEIVKVNDVITEYRSYEWNGYTPLGMIVKAQNDAGTFETKAYQFITNQHGDVLSIRNQDDKEVGSYSYDAYGNVLSVEGDVAKDNPIQYAGYYYDEETKNYYLQARYYNPENGAFLALDPHPGDDDEPLSQNGYAYGNNNPVISIDPNGNYAWILKSIAKYALKMAIRNPRNIKYVAKKINSFLRQKYVKKALKKTGYHIDSNYKGGYIIRVMHKNKRVLSIDYHSLGAFKKKGVDTKKYPIFHIHLGNDKTHYIPLSMIPKGFKIRKEYRHNPRYIFISESLF